MKATTTRSGPLAQMRFRAGAMPTAGRLNRWAQTWAGVLVVLVLFEALARSGVLSHHYFPPVSEMFAVLFRQLGTISFWTEVSNTLQGWGIGLGIAIGLGIPIGIAVGSSRKLYRAVRALIEFLRPIPPVALIPLAILIYGTGLTSKVFLTAFAAFWFVLIQTIYGARDIDPLARDTARAFGVGRLERLARVDLPSAVPYIATGVRLASTVALILAITAELVIGAPGLGQAINTARAGGATALMYALTIATGFLGWGLNTLFSQLQRRVLHWHPSYRSTAS